MNTLPPDFLDRLPTIVSPAHTERVLASFNGPALTTFRVNTLLADEDTTIAALTANGIHPEGCQWLDNAWSVSDKERVNLLASKEFADGHIYVQNLSSMVPVIELDPQPGEDVLDLTAAPGSKTSQIAALMNNEGYLAAVESVRGRYFKLKANLDRLGVTMVRPILKDGASVSRHRPAFFDRVLLDAPCSSEGRFRADDPETTRYWSLRKINEMRKKQRRLIKSAFASLKPGGTLVYSTCSFAPEENEGVVSWLLKQNPDSALEMPLTSGCPNFVEPLSSWKGKELMCRDARRILPDETMSGFFVAKIQKM